MQILEAIDQFMELPAILLFRILFDYTARNNLICDLIHKTCFVQSSDVLAIISL